MESEDEDDQKDHFVKKSPLVRNQTMSIAGVDKSAEDNSKTRNTARGVQSKPARYVILAHC